MSAGELLRVSDVFVSHTHIDHFIGFDRLLRIVFGSDKVIRLYGPEGFIRNVEGKLAGFTWNLVDRYDESITLQVTEVHADKLLYATFKAIDKFKRTDEAESPGPMVFCWKKRAFGCAPRSLSIAFPVWDL